MTADCLVPCGNAAVRTEVLGDLPLALEQVAAYLNPTQLPPADYVHLLSTRAAEMYGRGRVVDHRHTIATLWSLSLDHLRVRQPAAVQLLGLCAYLAPEPIPLDLFTAHSEQLPIPLGAVAGDSLAFAEMVGAVVDYSLARRTETGLLLHRLAQAVIRQRGPGQPTDSHSLPVVLGLLRADLPWNVQKSPQNWPRWRQLLAHVLVVTAHHDDAHPTAAGATSWLLDRAAIYQQTHGQPGTARPLVQRALHIHESTPCCEAGFAASLVDPPERRKHQQEASKPLILTGNLACSTCRPSQFPSQFTPVRHHHPAVSRR